MGGGSIFSMFDTAPLMRGDIPLALAKFLGNSMDPDSFNVMHTVADGLCKDCTVLGTKMDVIFENGTRADVSSGVYLHHIFSMNIVTDRKLKTLMTNSFIPFCGGGGGFFDYAVDGLMDLTAWLTNILNLEIFGFGAVDEFKQLFTTANGKFDSGFYFGQKDKLFFQAEVVNYRKQPQNVYIQMDVEYVPGRVGREASTAFVSTTSAQAVPI
jgi:hypothetical protein